MILTLCVHFISSGDPLQHRARPRPQHRARLRERSTQDPIKCGNPAQVRMRQDHYLRAHSALARADTERLINWIRPAMGAMTKLVVAGIMATVLCLAAQAQSTRMTVLDQAGLRLCSRRRSRTPGSDMRRRQ